jgi:hypothetical protein
MPPQSAEAGDPRTEEREHANSEAVFELRSRRNDLRSSRVAHPCLHSGFATSSVTAQWFHQACDTAHFACPACGERPCKECTFAPGVRRHLVHRGRHSWQPADEQCCAWSCYRSAFQVTRRLPWRWNCRILLLDPPRHLVTRTPALLPHFTASQRILRRRQTKTLQRDLT